VAAIIPVSVYGESFSFITHRLSLVSILQCRSVKEGAALGCQACQVFGEQLSTGQECDHNLWFMLHLSAGRMERKRKLEEDDGDDVQTQSAWLQRFLSQRKESTIPPAPVIIATDDIYLRQFVDQFPCKEVALQDTENINDEVFEGDSDVECNVISIITEESDEEYVLQNVRIRLFNLPYTMDANSITLNAKKFGIEFTSVHVEIDQKSNLPSGSASIELAPGIDESTAVQALQGEDFGGRPVRVQSEQRRKRRGSAGKAEQRYFFSADNANARCNICGHLGHTGRQCSHIGAAFPCHLCAGRDHEAGLLTCTEEK
jgi:hypothetical protein